MAIEEPAYEVVQKLDGAEVRLYAPYVVAEVVVDGPAEDAGNAAFPILAGYIFGKNKGAQKLEMTAPVTQTAAPVKLAMTAPVTQTAAPGGQLVQFVLPRSVTLATAPQPLDPRVQLREVPASRVAVIRYSGFWSQANYDEHLAKLQAALRTAQLTWTGEPVLSRYNPPITPWFLRRNEIWLAVEESAQR
ncbi:heme-binding protein [Pelomonas sp. HMWF004]|nr:heme-binding protein [Pelomonas sp. HMWF004]